ncbi:hypothetical protein [Lutimonas zeaxanthinifaciens]|uniref:hypothetical protein n=1 Tax=Lutimonas zeaxanthinifaciens TaxID=3060215 RepID=UPI00265CB3EB|nr:hypothetical protein [Lutimonas sp. YSD2104]WKK66211.1 hypothetical protein QZH61_00990 [Lutimonas sp. YSD2104]
MEAGVKELYHLHEETANWLSEMEFMKDEQLFLEHLLSTHFLDLSSSKLYEPTRKLIKRLKEVEALGTEIVEITRKHDENIGVMLENKQASRTSKLLTEHEKIKIDYDNYTLKFRYVKKKIFALIKDIMIQHKQKLLINKT